jgi:hypothetical protein
MFPEIKANTGAISLLKITPTIPEALSRFLSIYIYIYIYKQFQPLPPQINNRIDQSLLKVRVVCGIPFEVIENPFIVDLFRELNPAYVSPLRT